MSAIPEWQPDEPTDLTATDAASAQEDVPRPPADSGVDRAAPGPAGVIADVASGVGEELDQLADRPLAEHPEAYERIHARLQQSLAAIDDA